MSNASPIISILYRYYLQESLSDADTRLLQQWLAASEDNQNLFDDISNSKAWEEMIARLQTKDPEPTWQLIEERIQQQPKRIESSSMGWRVAAAIGGLLVILGAGWYFWRINQHSTNSHLAMDAVKKQPELLPGGNGKVRLTLSDGKLIELDNEQRQMISQDGQQVAEQVNGVVTYRANSNPNKEQFNRIETPIGQMFSVVLRDGTRVWLNAGSDLEYPVEFTGKDRIVTLHGEGYFEVTKKHQPFIVQTSRGNIQVLGTHFNVNDYANEPVMRTTLLEGSVRISNESEKTVLQPGMAAVITPDKKITAHPADTSAVMGWKNNTFWFKQSGYEEIFRQISRWYDVEVVFENRTQARFSGILPRDRPLSELLGIIEKGGQVHFVLEGRKLIVKQ
jgi:transmembrane sensor